MFVFLPVNAVRPGIIDYHSLFWLRWSKILSAEAGFISQQRNCLWMDDMVNNHPVRVSTRWKVPIGLITLIYRLESSEHTYKGWRCMEATLYSTCNYGWCYRRQYCHGLRALHGPSELITSSSSNTITVTSLKCERSMPQYPREVASLTP